MALTPVVAGVADHNGWAIFVSVSAKDGSPQVVDRRRVELIEPGLPKQPYEHETSGMNATEAGRLVQEVRESALHCAERALSQLRSSLGTKLAPGREAVSIALRAAPLPRLPGSVAEAHASWHVLMRADAMLYHDALCTAAASLGIEVATFPRGDDRRPPPGAMATTAARPHLCLNGLQRRLRPPPQPRQ